MAHIVASGGMAAINPDSTMAINATEAVAVEDLDKEVTRRLFLALQHYEDSMNDLGHP